MVTRGYEYEGCHIVSCDVVNCKTQADCKAVDRDDAVKISLESGWDIIFGENICPVCKKFVDDLRSRGRCKKYGK